MEPSAENSNRSHHNLQEMRFVLMERLWNGFAVIGLLAGPVSISRALVTGWLGIYTLHVILCLVVLVLFLLRNRVPFALKRLIVLVTFWIIGISGLAQFGVVGSGVWWLVISGLLMSFLHSIRAGLLVGISTVVVVMGIGLAFIYGKLMIPIDANAYTGNVVAWIMLLVNAIVMPLFVIQAIAVYQTNTQALLEALRTQRDQIEHLAHRDRLTGLPSLSLAEDRLEMALHAAHRIGTKVALMFVDLDGFKAVNDTYGHAAGDRMLQEVARRLSETIRDEDTAARVGGDEFMVVLGGVQDSTQVARVAERLVQVLSMPLTEGEYVLAVGASIGIALYPDHGTTAQTLRRVADEAMYSVKRQGKNHFAFAAPVSASPLGS